MKYLHYYNLFVVYFVALINIQGKSLSDLLLIPFEKWSTLKKKKKIFNSNDSGQPSKHST